MYITPRYTKSKFSIDYPMLNPLYLTSPYAKVEDFVFVFGLTDIPQELLEPFIDLGQLNLTSFYNYLQQQEKPIRNMRCWKDYKTYLDIGDWYRANRILGNWRSIALRHKVSDWEDLTSPIGKNLPNWWIYNVYSNGWMEIQSPYNHLVWWIEFLEKETFYGSFPFSLDVTAGKLPRNHNLSSFSVGVNKNKKHSYFRSWRSALI